VKFGYSARDGRDRRGVAIWRCSNTIRYFSVLIIPLDPEDRSTDSIDCIVLVLLDFSTGYKK
jgi:hypothetical protein